MGEAGREGERERERAFCMLNLQLSNIQSGAFGCAWMGGEVSGGEGHCFPLIIFFSGEDGHLQHIIISSAKGSFSYLTAFSLSSTIWLTFSI